MVVVWRTAIIHAVHIWGARFVGVPWWWAGVIGLGQNQRYMIRDCSACVFDPVKYSKLVRMVNATAKGFYVFTHNSPVQLARSHWYKGSFLQLDLSQPSASAGSASMNVTATSQHKSRVTTLVHAPEGEWGGVRWLFWGACGGV